MLYKGYRETGATFPFHRRRCVMMLLSPDSPVTGFSKIAQDEARGIRLAIEEQHCRFVEQCLREVRMALRALGNRLFEVPCQRHLAHLLPLAFAAAAFLALYSSHIAFARLMSKKACHPRPSAARGRGPRSSNETIVQNNMPNRSLKYRVLHIHLGPLPEPGMTIEFYSV